MSINSNSSYQTLLFLEVQVHLSIYHIQTDRRTKPTDKYQYLLKTSCHPNHTEKLSHSASFSESVAYPLPTLSLTTESKSSSTWSKWRASYPTSRNTTATRTESHKNRPNTLCHILQSFNPALHKISSVVKTNITTLQSSANCKKSLPSSTSYCLQT